MLRQQHALKEQRIFSEIHPNYSQLPLTVNYLSLQQFEQVFSCYSFSSNYTYNQLHNHDFYWDLLFITHIYCLYLFGNWFLAQSRWPQCKYFVAICDDDTPSWHDLGQERSFVKRFDGHSPSCVSYLMVTSHVTFLEGQLGKYISLGTCQRTMPLCWKSDQHLIRRVNGQYSQWPWVYSIC